MKDIEMLDMSYYTVAENLERELGDPMDASVPFSFKQSVELDEREEFPATLCTLLEEWGLQDYYVPVQYGGKLRNFAESFTLVRTIARRDLSVAIAHGKTFLGSAPVWIAGTTEQRADLARRILNREYIALALTEEAHGGDLAASECTARKIHNQYLLFGPKWLVNNATRSTALCLLAKTHARGGPLGVSLFYVEKNKLDPKSFHHLPKIKTHGVKNIDISGIAFENATLAEHALIGKEHHGLEPIFKTFQITRPLCSALSLGAADTALRLALNFALKRRLYDDTVFALPAAREVLVGAFADLLICDCMALFVSRALHEAPQQMSLWSSVTKYFVPTTIENMVRDTATILGARYYLRDHYAFGMFQKVVRDVALISLFDGSTRVNLSLIAGQLGQVAHYEEMAGTPSVADVMSQLKRICFLQQALPEFDLDKLALTNRGRDDLRFGLLCAAEQFDVQSDSGIESPSVEADIRLLLRRFAQERNILDQAVRDLVAKQGDIHVSVEGFELAAIHCILHAASACYHMWLFNKSTLEEGLASGDWLVLCLIKLLKLLYPREELVSPLRYSERVAQTLLQLLQRNRMFGMVPIQFASSQSDFYEVNPLQHKL